MKQSKFIEGVLVRLDKQLAYSIVPERTKTFFRTILPLFNADYLRDTPGLLLASNGSQLTIRDLATIASCTQEEAVTHLNELARHGFVLRDLKTGAIECPIAGEVIKRHILAVEAGKLGGNPALKRKNSNEQPTKALPKPKTKPKAKAKSKSKGWPAKKASLKVFNPTVAFTLPKESTLESIPYLKDQVTLNSVELAPQSESEDNPSVGIDSFIVTIEAIINGQKTVLKGKLGGQDRRQTPAINGKDNAQHQNSINSTYCPTHFFSAFLVAPNQFVNLLSRLQVTVTNNLTGEIPNQLSSNFSTGCDVPLTVSLSNRLGDSQGGQVDTSETQSAEASHVQARHARGSHGSRRDPILNTNNTLHVLKPYLTKYNCATNVARSLCEPGGAGGIFEKTSNSPDEPNVDRPTTLPTHETKSVANLDSLSANRPELFSPGSGLDGGTFPTANRTELTPASDLSFPVTGGPPTQTPLATEPAAIEVRPITAARLPRFEHSLAIDPALEGNDAGTKKPFVLKILPIPNPFSSHPEAAKGDPELAKSLLNGGLLTTKTPSQTTRDRQHEETTPPSCAPPPPPFSPVARHAPAPSDFTGYDPLDDFDPSELYDDDTPIEDFDLPDLSDRPALVEPNDSDFAPIFDPPKNERLEMAPEAILDTKNTSAMQSDYLSSENAPTGFLAPATGASVLSDNPELKFSAVEAEEIQKPEKKNPELVTIDAVPRPAVSVVPVLPGLEIVSGAGDAGGAGEDATPAKAKKPKRAKTPKKPKTEDPNDPAQAAYLANYHRMMDFYRDKIKAKIPNYAAQGQAVKWLLLQGGYTPEECEACLLDQFENWTKGSPSWLTVKSHIAAWKLRKENPVQPKPVPRPQRQFYSNGDERRNNRIPTATQQLNEIVKAVDNPVAIDLSDPNFAVPTPAATEAVIPCSVPNVDTCLNMLRRFHTAAIHLKKTGGMPVGVKLNHVGADWVYSQCKFPLDIETLSFEEIEKRFRQHHARLVAALTKQTKAGNIGSAQNTQNTQSTTPQTASSLLHNPKNTHKGV